MMYNPLLRDILKAASEPFYYKWDFWISQIFSLIGFYLTWKAYVEAKKAKEAAEQAADLVKNVSMVGDLKGLITKLKRLNETIAYDECRHLFLDAVEIISRLPTSFKKDQDAEPILTDVDRIIVGLTEALASVRPIVKGNSGATNTVFIAVESLFLALVIQISRLSGLLEEKTTKLK